MYAVLAMAVLGIAGLLMGGLLAAVARKTGKATGAARAVAIMLLIAVPLPFLVGTWGTHIGEAQVEEAVAAASEASKATLKAAGQSVSGIPQLFGLCTSMACLMPAALLCVLVAGKRESWQTAMDAEED